MAGFDATQGHSSGGGGNGNNILFGVIALSVIAGVFCFGLFGPNLMGPISRPAANQITVQPISVIVAGLDETQANGALQVHAFPTGPTNRMLKKLAEVDRNAYARLFKTLTEKAMNGANRNDLALEVAKVGEQVLQRQKRHLALSDGKYFTELLVLSRETLDGFRNSSDAKYCKADNLQDLFSGDQQAAAAANLISDLVTYDSRLYNFAMDANYILLSAVEDGKTDPKRYGRFQKSDEQAIQTLVMGMFQDPQFMIMMQAAMVQGGEPDFSGLDVCALGDRVLAGLVQLPEGTRNRIWSTGLADALSGDMKNFQSFAPGF